MSKYLLGLLIIGLTACDNTPDVVKSRGTDQCMRAELFKSCMASLPAGPVATDYNDWQEVVDECGTQAYYQSIRFVEFIKPECRVD